MAPSVSASPQRTPSPAVAPPPGNPRFPLVDSVRAIAVLSVLIYHVGAITGALNTAISGDLMAVAGAQALSVLFMTSGFLLYRPFVRARASGRTRPSTRRYLRRRMLRILPAYWFALTVLAIYPGISGVFSGDWWRYYLFLQLYSHRTINAGIPPAWTLCVEMSFYFALPLWAMLMRRVRWGSGERAWVGGELAALGIVALGGVIVQLLAARLLVSDLIADSLLGNCTWIAVGMALAVISAAFPEPSRQPRVLRLLGEHAGISLLIAAACWIGATAILQPGGLLGVLASLQRPQGYPRVLGSIVLTGGVIVCLIAPTVFGEPSRRSLTRRVLAARAVMWTGLVSYGVYLWHLAVVSLLGEHADPGHFSARGLGLADRLHHFATPVLALLTLGVTAAIAALSYHFVELPFLRLKER